MHPEHLSDQPLKDPEKTLVNKIITTLKRPDAKIEKIVVGTHFTGLVAGGRMGLSSLLGASPGQSDRKKIKTLISRPVSEAALLTTSPSPFSISLGFAAVNAANAPDPVSVNPSGLSADELVAKLGKNKTTGLVGEFPFTRTLAEKVEKFHLFELNNSPFALPRDQWETTLPRLDVLAITGTALLTRYMAWYLSKASQAKIIILGPTTPISDILFKYGVDYLCGSAVTDPARVTRSIEQGH
ncbi:MAG: DUF364 domain-containing protein, partial [Desulfobacterales bacterium]|nr:DUF364 domain-containing protein [Desulfobacterales bacterium]